MAKKQTNEERIVAAMDALDKSVRNLQKFGARYNDYIDEAALRGDDGRARQLIKQKLRVCALAEQLTTLKSNLELGAYTSQAISDLGKLPAAIAGCKGLLAESPDFSKLGKSITAIFRDISSSEAELAKLNEILDPKPALRLGSTLDSIPEDEQTDAFKAEYEEMMVRIKPRLSPETVAKPDGAAAVESTGNIDYAGIIAEENRKK